MAREKILRKRSWNPVMGPTRYCTMNSSKVPTAESGLRCFTDADRCGAMPYDSPHGVYYYDPALRRPCLRSASGPVIRVAGADRARARPGEGAGGQPATARAGPRECTARAAPNRSVSEGRAAPPHPPLFFCPFLLLLGLFQKQKNITLLLLLLRLLRVARCERPPPPSAARQPMPRPPAPGRQRAR